MKLDKPIGNHSNLSQTHKNRQMNTGKHAGYFKTQLLWPNIIGITALHVITVYIIFIFPYLTSFATFLSVTIHGILSGFGVTAAVHRFWTHQTYKAKLPLKILLLICYTMAGQNTIYDWVRDHRVHHKYSETIADPHDSNRGFFFAHIGWLMMKKHPEVLKKGRLIDMSDIVNDPVVQFHQKYFVITKLLLCFVIPIAIPCYFWEETLFNSTIATIARYCVVLNFTWSVNSIAHLYGNRPYNTKIQPRESLFVSIVAMGEGWHNYHHTFPWDYKSGEFGKLNVTTFWLHLFEKMGLAYDLKSPSADLVAKVIKSSGDGTYKWGHEVREENVQN